MYDNSYPPARPHRDHRPALICLSHLRWNFVYQRPQHLLSRAALDYEVYFFEEPIVEGTAAPRLECRTAENGVTVAVPILPRDMEAALAVRAQRDMLDQLLQRLEHRQIVFWYYTPMALLFSRHRSCDVCIYDNMDELSAFKDAPASLLALEEELFKRCDYVFTGGHSLYEAKRGRHRSVYAFPSSIDAAHFDRARGGGLADPADQAPLPRPRLGFFGVIDERMDTGLLARLADLRPAWQIVMVGPVVKIDPASLPQRPNIHWLGGKDYRALPAYLAHWDVGLMPFAMNESTRFISPTKTPEYLAAGVPVVSTPIHDVVRPYGERGLVEIAATAEGVVERAEALLRRPRERWLREVDEALAGNSWDDTWSRMDALIRSASRAVDAPVTAAAQGGGHV